jgi:creatinine deaminase
MQGGLAIAIAEAMSSHEQGGIPIGAALTDAEGNVFGKGHNQRIQSQSPILHAEIACLADVGRRKTYSNTILYSTLMPCYMCAGAIVQFRIPCVVVGESQSFLGAAQFLWEHDVEVIDLHNATCEKLLAGFILEKPELWLEDIGE